MRRPALVLRGLDMLVGVFEIVRVNVRVVTARVTVHLESRMNRPVSGEDDCRQGGGDGPHPFAQGVHPLRRLSHDRSQSQQAGARRGGLPLPGHFFITGLGTDAMRRLSLLDVAVILAVLAVLVFAARVEFEHYTHGTLDPHAVSAPAPAE